MGELAKKIDQPETLPADPMVSMIERIALDPNADISKLEKMLEMKERIEERDARRAFDNAIAAAKADIPPILKTGTVDYVNTKGQRTNFNHETLDGIARIVDPILSNCGLSYRFRSDQVEGNVCVTCIVAHRDGYSEETTLRGSPDTSGSKNAYQAVGSAVTYLQRYTLKLALGLAATKDDDATGAAGVSTVTPEQFVALRDILEQSGADQDKFLKAYGAASLEQFPADKLDAATGALRRKMEKSNA